MTDKTKKIAAIYKATPKDYKLIRNNKKMIIIFEPGLGTILIAIEDLTDSEIEKRYKEAIKK